jgi:hypothetical protein
MGRALSGGRGRRANGRAVLGIEGIGILCS